jgi:hypothetical protein
MNARSEMPISAFRNGVEAGHIASRCTAEATLAEHGIAHIPQLLAEDSQRSGQIIRMCPERMSEGFRLTALFERSDSCM